MTETMSVWDQLCVTDPQFTKPFDRGGFKGTDINPMYRWRLLTETFGPAGVGWGVESHDAKMVDLPDSEKMICVSVVGFYVWNGERHLTPPGFGQDYVVKQTRGGMRSDDESAKKAFTDALGNAFKYLGLGADVFLRMHDDSKYVNSLKEKFSDKPKKAADQNDPPEKSAPAESAQPTPPVMVYPDIPEDRGHLLKGKDGAPYFIHQDSDEGNSDLANLAAWYLPLCGDLSTLTKVSTDNYSTLFGLKTDAGVDPIEQGAMDWATAKLANIKTEKGLKAAWTKIAAEVNQTKESNPPLFSGITKAFKERKREILNG